MNSTTNRSLTILITFFISIFAVTVNAQYEDGVIYLKMSDSSSMELDYPLPAGFNGNVPAIYEIFKNYNVTSVHKPFQLFSAPKFNKIYEVNFNDITRANGLISELEALQYVEYAEKVPIAKTFVTPNDPDLPYQIALMNGYNAFDIHNGGGGTAYKATIAIVDDAVLTNHEDLMANIIPGYDVADMNTDPNPPTTGQYAASQTVFSHGTRVAGIAGAVTNNNIGIASMSWNCNLLPVKCVKDDENPIDIRFGYKGIEWAAINGAEIINCSWGSSDYSQVQYEVIKAAKAMGVVIVASAGNGNSSLPNYPAAYGSGTTGENWEQPDNSLVIAVASIDANGNRSATWTGGALGGIGGSQFGPWVDISGYGTGIYSTTAGAVNNYTTGNGTSFAAPGIAAALALMKSYQPSKPFSEILECLLNSANTDIYNQTAHPNNIPGTLGSGRIDVLNALSCLSGCDHPTATIKSSSIYLCPGGTVELEANNGTVYSWSQGSTTQSINISNAGNYTVTVTQSGGCTATESIEILPAPTNANLFVFENSGNVSNDGNTCGTDVYQLTAYGGNSYQWSQNGNPNSWTGSSYNILSSLAQPLPETISYAVTITDMFGCIGLTGSSVVEVNRFAYPVGSLQVFDNSGTINDGLICLGSQATLVATGGSSYIWSTGATTSSITVSPTISTDYSVTITNSAGCSVLLEKGVTVSTCAPYISCTPCSNSPQSINIIASNNGTLYSTLGLPNLIENKNCISISGKLIVDINLTIKNCTNILMSAGSEIIVGNGIVNGINPTLQINNCRIKGCYQMWKGITVRPFSHLVFKDNSLEDAEFAIEAQPSPITLQALPTRIEVERNFFTKNHVGVYFPNGFGNVWHYPIDGNTFWKILTDELLPPTNINIVNYEASSGFAGIVAEGNISGLIVGTPNTSGFSNTFLNIRNGVLSKHNRTTIERGDFRELPGFAGSQGGATLLGSPRGIGVLVENNISTIKGSKFNNCGHGIYSNNSILYAHNNTMPKVAVGIQLNSPSTFVINSVADPQQTINYKEYGVLARNLVFFNGLDFLKYRVENNKIDYTNYSFGTPNTCVKIENSQDPVIKDKLARINMNILNPKGLANGIELNNHSHWDLYDNIINPGFGSNKTGFQLSNCSDTYLLNNDILGEDFSTAVGISVRNSYETEFCCNRISEVSVGTDFFGPCETTIYRTTTNSTIFSAAVRCSEATMLGDQPDILVDPLTNYGNLFEGGWGTVIHLGSDLHVADSEFFVETGDLPDHPNSIQTPNVINADWFQVTGFEKDNCGDCEDAFSQSPRAPMIYSTDINFATGAYQNTTYGEMVNWEVQYSLYKKLKNNPTLIGYSPKISAFYYNAFNGKIDSFYTVENAIRSISNIPSTLASSINSCYATLLSNEATLENLKNRIYQAYSISDSLEVYHNVNQFTSTMANTYSTFTNYMKLVDSIKAGNVLNAIALNNALFADNLIQSNIKSVNEIYLSSVANGLESLTTQQFQIVKNIAYQCPLVGGKAVYRARTLLSLEEDGNFDDSALCNFAYRNSDMNSSSRLIAGNLALYPNPTTGRVTINYITTDSEDNNTLKVFTSTGQLVFETQISRIESMMEIDLSSFPPGLYICTVSGENTPTRIGKLIIHH